jgi:hypothetical protein
LKTARKLAYIFGKIASIFITRHLTGNGFSAICANLPMGKSGNRIHFCFAFEHAKISVQTAPGAVAFNAINYPIEFSKSCTKSNQFGNLCIPNTKFMQISSPRFPLGIGPQLNHPKWLSLKIKIFHSGGH